LAPGDLHLCLTQVCFFLCQLAFQLTRPLLGLLCLVLGLYHQRDQAIDQAHG
jgi:hypothetical protein